MSEKMRRGENAEGEGAEGDLLPNRSVAEQFYSWVGKGGEGNGPQYEPMKFLFIDDSASPVPNGTLAFMKAATAAWGCHLVGWIATDHHLSYGMGGFHPIRHYDPLFQIYMGRGNHALKLLKSLQNRDVWEDQLLRSLTSPT